MGTIVLFVIFFIILGVGLSFFSGANTNASGRNSHSVFTQDVHRDYHKDRVNKSLSQQRFLDNDYNTETKDAKNDTPVLKDQTKQSPSDKEEYDDFFKEYDDFFEQDDDPFKQKK